MTLLPQLMLPIAQGSLSFPLNTASAQALFAELERLGDCFRAKAANPKEAQASLEFIQKEPLFVEVFCNPNIWPTPFSAKLLITIKSPLVRVSVEVELPQLQDQLSQFIAEHS